MDLPRLKAHLVARAFGSDRVFLVCEDGHYLVQGKAVTAVLPYLDGTHTIAEIAEKLAERFTMGEVVFAVSKFQRFGHLVDGAVGEDRAVAAAWEGLGLDTATALRRLGAARIEVAALGAVDAAAVVAALREIGATVTPVTPAEVGADVAEGRHGPDLTVVLTDDYLDPRLNAMDARLRAAGLPWLLVKPTGAEVWTGPYLVPGRTGCWHCLAHRLAGNQQVETFLRRRDDGTVADDPIRTSLAATAWSVGLSAHLVAATAAELLAGDRSEYEGVLVSLHVAGRRLEQHRLIRQPQCPGCGDPALLLDRDPRIELADQPVVFDDEGGHRTMRPDDTFNRLEKHIGRLLGAVSSLRLLNNVDNGVTFSYAASHNFAVPGRNIAMLRRNLRGQSGGKGRSDVQARVSGVCEAIERYSGVWRDDRSTEPGSFAELGPDLAVHPYDLLLYSDTQYETRETWNRESAGRLHLVPERFDEARRLHWSRAWSLTEDRPRLVPAGYSWFGHPDLHEHFFCFSDGNGNASGNTLEEAIMQGLFESCERDAVGLWWYNRALRPGFDLDSLREPYVDTLREFYAGMQRTLEVVDITTDLGVPTFAAVSRRVDHPVEDILLGFGAHLDVRIAVLRALTEVNQFLPAVINRNPDGTTRYWEDDPHTLAWLHTATAEREPWALPAPHLPATTLAGYGTLHSGDIARDIRDTVDRLRAVDLEVIVLDQSLPDLELHVAKVMVPGLRHFWRRLGPGRMYDTPVRLGWLDAPTPEAELNPYSVFF
ncbi:TOMM precursor leader peptide-binding protein [Embleya sp. NPDC005971]|uniref:TOMM precursor leader peptide-binding protein n=1 Tax=Embleya sp. NPDC005971 TaxID=3156724 RepID=UPI0033D82BD5